MMQIGGAIDSKMLPSVEQFANPRGVVTPAAILAGVLVVSVGIRQHNVRIGILRKATGKPFSERHSREVFSLPYPEEVGAAHGDGRLHLQQIPRLLCRFFCPLRPLPTPFFRAKFRRCRHFRAIFADQRVIRSDQRLAIASADHSVVPRGHVPKVIALLENLSSRRRTDAKVSELRKRKGEK